MPRKPRLEFEGAFYHIYNRGNRRERLFWSDVDYQEFEEYLWDIAFRMGVNLYAWCLMPNHFHLLIETPLANLSAFMQRLLSRYARAFNQAHRQVGHVFQGRYGAKLCDKEAYLLELTRYIHLNPYRLKKGTLAGFGEWKWSSHRFYVGEEAPLVARPYIDSVLERFGATRGLARQAYATFLADGLASGTWEDFYGVRGDRFLGDEGFIQDAKAKCHEPVRAQARPSVRSLAEIAQAVADEFGVPLQVLPSSRRHRSVSQARQILAYVARKYWRQPTHKLANFLKKDPSAISHMLAKVEHSPNTARINAILSRLNKESEEVYA